MQTITARNEIVERYAHLVRPVALSLKRRLPASFDLDDLIQTGMLGLMAAAERYEDGRADTFTAYARQKIRGAILDSSEGRAFRESTYEALEDNVYQLRAPALLPDEICAREQERSHIAGAVATLTERQRKVIELRFGQDLPQWKTGEELGGISQAGARDLEQRAFRQIRQRLAKVIEFPRQRTAAA